MECLWSDRKRTLFGLPWSFTKYSMDEERLFIDSGFLKTRSDEVRLYRILDVSLTCTLFQRMFNIGDVLVHSSDKTLGDFVIKSVKNPRDVKELISNNVEIQRDKKRVTNRELMSDHDHEHDFDDGDDMDELR